MWVGFSLVDFIPQALAFFFHSVLVDLLGFTAAVVDLQWVVGLQRWYGFFDTFGSTFT